MPLRVTVAHQQITQSLRNKCNLTKHCKFSQSSGNQILVSHSYSRSDTPGGQRRGGEEGGEGRVEGRRGERGGSRGRRRGGGKEEGREKGKIGRAHV